MFYIICMHRWYEYNCAGQCKACNAWEQGKSDTHREYIKKKYGQKVVDLLDLKEASGKRTPVKMYAFELEAMIVEYQKKAKAEAEKRGIEL